MRTSVKRLACLCIVGLFITQIVAPASRGEIRNNVDTAVMQSIVGSAGAGTN